MAVAKATGGRQILKDRKLDQFHQDVAGSPRSQRRRQEKADQRAGDAAVSRAEKTIGDEEVHKKWEKQHQAGKTPEQQQQRAALEKQGRQQMAGAAPDELAPGPSGKSPAQERREKELADIKAAKARHAQKGAELDVPAEHLPKDPADQAAIKQKQAERFALKKDIPDPEAAKAAREAKLQAKKAEKAQAEKAQAAAPGDAAAAQADADAAAAQAAKKSKLPSFARPGAKPPAPAPASKPAPAAPARSLSRSRVLTRRL